MVHDAVAAAFLFLLIVTGNTLGQTVIICSEPVTKEQEQRGTSEDQPFTLRVYNDIEAAKYWEVKTGPSLMAKLTTDRSHLVAVTAEKKSFKTLVQIYDLSTGELLRQYALADFLPSFNWRGNGPPTTNGFLKSENSDRFYLIGYQSEQSEDRVSVGAKGYEIRLPKLNVPTVVTFTDSKETSRFRLDEAPGNFAAFASPILLGEKVLLRCYNIEGGPGGGLFPQYSIADLRTRKVTTLNQSKDRWPFSMTDSVNLNDSGFLVVDPEKSTFARFPEGAPIQGVEMRPIIGLDKSCQITCLPSASLQDHVPMVLNYLRREGQGQGVLRGGESRMAVLNTSSGTSSPKSRKFDSPINFAVAIDTGEKRKYYALTRDKLVILDSELTLVHEMALDLDFPYEVIVSP